MAKSDPDFRCGCGSRFFGVCTVQTTQGEVAGRNLPCGLATCVSCGEHYVYRIGEKPVWSLAGCQLATKICTDAEAELIKDKDF